MTLPVINASRLQRVVADAEFGTDLDFNQLCQAVSETPWAKSFDLTPALVAALVVHHKTITKVKKPDSVDIPEEETSDDDDVKVVKTYDVGGKGRKQCKACNKYVGLRVTVCACGSEFKKKSDDDVDDDDDVKVVKTYDVGGKGKKLCTSCNKYVGLRVTVCVCGHPFVVKKNAPAAKIEKQENDEDVEETVVPVSVTQTVSSITNRRHVHNTGRMRIHTPSGSCPHRLTATDVESVEQWAENVRRTYLDRDNSWLTLPALKYFVREFFPFFTSAEVLKETGQLENPEHTAVVAALDLIYGE